jgi:hypothetical protein
VPAFRRLRVSRVGRLVIPVVATGIMVVVTALPGNAIVVPATVANTLASANPADQTPDAQDGDVRAYAQIGSTVYVGGSFTSIKNAGDSTWTPRSYLFAFNESTGAIITGFVPDLDGVVHALAVSPDGKLIVGGAFATVNGVSRKNLVELDPATGQTVAGWAGRGDGGIVRRLITFGNLLYIGGAFHWINGVQHSLLARLNATTGALDPTFQLDASVPRASSELVWGLALAPDGRTLVAVGNFTEVNGLPRNQIAVMDVSGTPAVADWSTDRFVAPCYNWAFPFYARDVDFSDDGSYFVVGADGGRGDGYCDAISRWETSARGANVDATWVDFTGTDSVTSVEAADGVVYVAGHFRWLNNANGNDSAGPGAVNRYGVGALDPSNGVPLNWNPTRSPGANLPSGGTSWGPLVWELWRGNAGLYFGQDSDGMGNEYHGRMGLFPLGGGRVVSAVNASQATSGFLYLGAGDGYLTKAAFNGASVGAPTLTSQPNLASTGAAFAAANKLYWSKTDASAPSGSSLEVSVFSNGTAGAPWVGSGYNSWFQAAGMNGAFFLNGRMYYTMPGSDTLYYRYLEPDGYVVGCTAFTLPTQNLAWSVVRGMTWVAGQLVYGSVDGTLRSVAFDPTAANGYAVDGTSPTVLATPTAQANWSNPTLFYATS